jgi:hypothetical protein
MERRGTGVAYWWGKPRGKRPLGRPRLVSVENNMTGLEETGLGAVDWIGLAQDRDKW